MFYLKKIALMKKLGKFYFQTIKKMGIINFKQSLFKFHHFAKLIPFLVTHLSHNPCHL